MAEESDFNPLEGLTDREAMVATAAAKLAEQRFYTNIYRQVGKTLVTKIFVWAGLLAVGLGVGKGWIPLPPGK